MTTRLWCEKSPFLLSLVLVIALGASADSSAAQSDRKLETRADLIQRLESAKKIDSAAALDPTVSPLRQGSFLNQMNKVNRTLDALEHGGSPSGAEINDALWIPPSRLSPTERERLIEKLEQARRQDDQNEQQMLADLTWSSSIAPADTATFDDRKAQIDEVINDLRIGAPVRWTDIHHALSVPESPY